MNIQCCPLGFMKRMKDWHLSTKILVALLVVVCLIAVGGVINAQEEKEPKIIAFHHVGISTGDLDRSIKFYRDLLGCELLSESSWPVGSATADQLTGLKNSSARYVMMKAGNSHIEIFEYGSPEPKKKDPRYGANDHGFNHFGIMVDDIEAMYKKLLDAGTFFNAPPTELAPGFAVTYGRDPDGNLFELMGQTKRSAPGVQR